MYEFCGKHECKRMRTTLDLFYSKPMKIMKSSCGQEMLVDN